MLKKIRPRTLKIWLIVAALVYLLLPFDLISDFLGIAGRIDDVALMGLLLWFYRNHLRQFMQAQTGHGTAGAESGHATPEPPKTRGPVDAYEVLGVGRSASSDEIKSAYRARMQEYHPDKVSHLGSELQQLAHEKSQDIQRAYRELLG